MSRIPRLQPGINKDFEKTVDYYVIFDPADTWRHNPEKIPIKMKRTFVGKTSFSCIDRTRNIKLENESIDEVLIAVDNIIKNRASIAWAPKLAIEIGSFQSQAPIKSSDILNIRFTITVTPIETGVDEHAEKWERTQGSKFIQKEQSRNGYRPNWTNDPIDSWRDVDHSHILIDDTPEHRQALKEFAERFKTFLTELYGIFEPDRIDLTMKSLFESGAFLLPAHVATNNPDEE